LAAQKQFHKKPRQWWWQESNALSAAAKNLLLYMHHTELTEINPSAINYNCSDSHN